MNRASKSAAVLEWGHRKVISLLAGCLAGQPAGPTDIRPHLTVAVSVATPKTVYRAQLVVLAIGKRGIPRRLGVPVVERDCIPPVLRTRFQLIGENMAVLDQSGCIRVEKAVAA
jgi:hypothetical protein